MTDLVGTVCRIVILLNFDARTGSLPVVRSLLRSQSQGHATIQQDCGGDQKNHQTKVLRSQTAPGTGRQVATCLLWNSRRKGPVFTHLQSTQDGQGRPRHTESLPGANPERLENVRTGPGQEPDAGSAPSAGTSTVRPIYRRMWHRNGRNHHPGHDSMQLGGVVIQMARVHQDRARLRRKPHRCADNQRPRVGRSCPRVVRN